MTPERSEQPLRSWGPDDTVVDRPKWPAFPVPLFGDPAWDLRCIGDRPNKADHKLTFTGFGPDARPELAAERVQGAKELMAQRINEPIASSRRRRVVKGYACESCDLMLTQLRQAYRFMDAHGIARIADLVQDDLDLYAKALLEAFPDPRGKMTRAAAMQVFVWLWESRGYLSHGGLSFNPWGGRPVTKVVGYVRPRETLTPRIPEPVMAGLLPWALEYVDGFSTDIIRAEQDYYGIPGEPQVSDEGLSLQRYDKFLDQLRADGRGVPAIWNFGVLRPCEHLIERRANVRIEWVVKSPLRWAALRHCIEELGLDPACLAPSTHVPEGYGVPLVPCSTIQEMTEEGSRLAVAAYIVCAYLSGMRDSEVQDLRRGCVEEKRDEAGKVYRYFVRSKEWKGNDVPEERTWVVIEPVARAINVMEALTAPFFAGTGDDHLFVHHRRSTNSTALFKAYVVAMINAFAAHCNDTLAPRAAKQRLEGSTARVLGAIPEGPDGRWHFTTRQFRKTLAWHIANRPFGSIAGMVQYGHASVVMFEGYAGHADSGFLAEKANQEFIARTGDVMAMCEESLDGIQPAGPIAEELKAEFARISAEIGPFKGEVADRDRLAQLVKMRASSMRLGVLAHCFYEPSQARCLQHLDPAERRDRQPVTGLCDPDCPRACWTKDHLPAWRQLADEAEGLARLNRVSPPQRHILRCQAANARRTIAAIEEARGGRT